VSVSAGWFALFAAFAYLMEGRSALQFGEGLEKVPVVGGAFKKVCALIVMIMVLPAGWADVKVLIGAFQLLTGIRFTRFHDWWSHVAPGGVQLLTAPLIIVVVAPIVSVVFLATIAPVIWVYLSIAR
jgi:hypothetical protein